MCLVEETHNYVFGSKLPELGTTAECSSACGTAATTGSTAMTGFIVGVPLRTGIGTELLTIENHSSGLLNNTGARRASTLFHQFHYELTKP